MTTSAMAIQPSSGVPAARPQSSRQQTAANLLKRIRDNHLSIRSDYQALLAAFMEGQDELSRKNPERRRAVFLRPLAFTIYQPRTEEEREEGIAHLNGLAAQQPDIRVAQSLLTRVTAAVDQDLDASEARLAVALMIDAYPNARPHSPEAYIASIMDAICELGAPTVAVSMACHDLKTETTFLPALGEVVQRVKDSAESLRSMHDRLTYFDEWSKAKDEALGHLRNNELAPEEASA